MKHKNNQIITGVEILSAGSEGKCVARVEGKVIFVSNAVPGDIADLEVFRKKRSYMEARAIRFDKLSEQRVQPFCEHFGTCGGCKWQHMEYAAQLKYKQQQVEDALTRIGKVDAGIVSPILPSSETQYYRNKLEFTFSNKRWFESADEKPGEDADDRNMNALGFHIPGRFDRVLDVKHCYLQASRSNEIRLAIKDYALKHALTFFDLKQQNGFLRNLIIRNATTAELMVIVCFFHEDEAARIALLNALAEQFPEITSLMYVINPKGNDTIYDLDVNLFRGKDHLTEEMEGLKFKIGPKSFFQTNTKQALELYRLTREFAGLTGKETVYDLYTGTGTIANFVAGSCSKVVGLEYIPEAIEDAKENSVINNIHNTSFFAGDIKDVLSHEFINTHGNPDVIITDPPRAGMHEDVVRKIMEVGPAKVVYVSCNPATQARDIAWMSPMYEVKKMQPVDMFPHTHHVENVILLELAKQS
jgi:23S rRNA (uracil1939-C5)-methyltransferase